MDANQCLALDTEELRRVRERLGDARDGLAGLLAALPPGGVDFGLAELHAAWREFSWEGEQRADQLANWCVTAASGVQGISADFVNTEEELKRMFNYSSAGFN